MTLEPDGRTIYVPVKRSPLRHTIKPGSGIVGTTLTDGWVLIDYEGNLYDAVNLRLYSERVRHAYDRHVTSYPTTARCFAEPKELVEVGNVLPQTSPPHVVAIVEQDIVDQWCDS